MLSLVKIIILLTQIDTFVALQAEENNTAISYVVNISAGDKLDTLNTKQNRKTHHQNIDIINDVSEPIINHQNADDSTKNEQNAIELVIDRGWNAQYDKIKNQEIDIEEQQENKEWNVNKNDYMELQKKIKDLKRKNNELQIAVDQQKQKNKQLEIHVDGKCDQQIKTLKAKLTKIEDLENDKQTYMDNQSKLNSLKEENSKLNKSLIECVVSLRDTQTNINEVRLDLGECNVELGSCELIHNQCKEATEILKDNINKQKKKFYLSFNEAQDCKKEKKKLKMKLKENCNQSFGTNKWIYLVLSGVLMLIWVQSMWGDQLFYYFVYLIPHTGTWTMNFL